MATYAIGDIQGCYHTFQALLHTIKFKPEKDHLWLTGDLVNRGSDSLRTLRFIKRLPKVTVVLGNHDLFLIALAYQVAPKKSHNLQPILDATDAEDLINWLVQQPFLHYDEKFHMVMVHAGILPCWSIKQACQYAKEAEQALQLNPKCLYHLYHDTSTYLNQNINKKKQIAFIMQSFTRMRFCLSESKLDFNCKTSVKQAPKFLYPWYTLRKDNDDDPHILFGHWATLQGKTNHPKIHALDGGAVWGNHLIALCLETKKRYYVAAEQPN